MEHYLSITEMARLRSITTETLRYYDRIGLLKPDYLDKNKVRYYSVLKYEQLETIKELQQLGLELKEIAGYLADRRIDTSYDLLQRQQNFCAEKIRYYQALEEKIRRKITLLSSLRQTPPALMKPELIHLEDRFYVSSGQDVRDEISLAYACMKLENQIKQQDDLVPVYASDCYAGIFSMCKDDLAQTRLLFFVQPETPPNLELTATMPGSKHTAPIPGPEHTASMPDPEHTATMPGPEHTAAMPDPEHTATLPAGTYLRLYSADSFWQRTAVRECFRAYAEKNGLRLSSEAIVISKIDYSITDVPGEWLYEFQVRIEVPSNGVSENHTLQKPGLPPPPEGHHRPN